MKPDLRPHIFLLVAERDPLPSDYMELFFQSGSPDLDAWFAAIDSLKQLELLSKNDHSGWLTDQGVWLKTDVNKHSTDKQERLAFVAGYINSLEAFNQYLGPVPPACNGDLRGAESAPGSGSAQHNGDTLQELFLLVDFMMKKHMAQVPDRTVN